MSYSATHGSLVFHSDRSFAEVEDSFMAFRAEYAARGTDHLVLSDETYYEDDRERGTSAGCYVHVYANIPLTDSRVFWAMCRWAAGLIKPGLETHVYCQSRSDAVLDEPYFIVVRSGQMASVDVSDLLNQQQLEWVPVAATT